MDRVVDRLADLLHHGGHRTSSPSSSSWPGSLQRTVSSCPFGQGSQVKKAADIKSCSETHWMPSSSSIKEVASTYRTDQKTGSSLHHPARSSPVGSDSRLSGCGRVGCMAAGRTGDGPLSEAEFKAVVAAMQALHGV